MHKVSPWGSAVLNPYSLFVLKRGSLTQSVYRQFSIIELLLFQKRYLTWKKTMKDLQGEPQSKIGAILRHQQKGQKENE